VLLTKIVFDPHWQHYYYTEYFQQMQVGRSNIIADFLKTVLIGAIRVKYFLKKIAG